MNRRYVAPLLTLSLLAFSACEKKPAPATPSSDSARATAAPATTTPAATPGETTPAAPVTAGTVKPTVGIGQVVSVEKGASGEAPNFSWKGSDGTSHSLADYRGQVVMLNFWGTWCPPCRHELPDIVKVRTANAAKGFEVIGLAVNEEAKEGMTVEQNLASFAKENNLEYPIVLANEELVQAFGEINVVPTTFIVNREGKIVQTLTGMKSEAEFASAIQAAQ
jgi:cytochrome c biogenesis protein CcmG/thiol:disulfide interchange protein DsbE